MYGVQRIAEIATKIEEKLVEISEFLCVKALQNIVLGSYPFQRYTFFLPLTTSFDSFIIIIDFYTNFFQSSFFF